MRLILKENNPLTVVIWIYTEARKTIKVSMLIRDLKQRRRRRQQERQKSNRFRLAKQQQLSFSFPELF